MSLASPAKQDRIERHLSRQRGAGVRSLATTFGFTFGATASPTEEHVKKAEPVLEPLAKRRKLDDTSGAAVKEQGRPTRNDESTSKSERQQKKKSRRRLESIEQDAVAQPKGSAENDSFVAAKKPAKARGVPPASETQDAPIRLHPSPARDEAPSRRPRRQAATAAIDKVSQGFMQEAQSIDTMRRNPEAKPTKRRATRKPVAAIIESDDSNGKRGTLAVGDSAKPTTSESRVDNPNPAPEKQRTKATGRKKQSTKHKIVSQSNTKSHMTPDCNDIPSATRLPLAETTTNPIVGSISPDKPLKPSDSLVFQRSPTREKCPMKVSVGSKTVIRGKRKPPNFVVSKDDPADNLETDLVDVGKGCKSQHVSELGSKTQATDKHAKASTQEQLPEAEDPATSKPTKRRRPCKNAYPQSKQPLINSSATGVEDGNDHSVQEKSDGTKRKRKEQERVSDDHVTKTKPESRTLDDGDGVDWLFDDEKGGKRTRPEKQPRSSRQRSVKNIAKLPDVDLDDLLSNIAAFVPRKTESKRLVGRSRT